MDALFPCLLLYSLPSSSGLISPQEQKDVLDHVVGVFGALDPKTFRLVFSFKFTVFLHYVCLFVCSGCNGWMDV